MLPDPRQRPTISVEEAGELFGLGRAAAYAAVKRGDIEAIRFGKRWLVPTAKVLRQLGLYDEGVA